METFCRGDVLCGDVLYVRHIDDVENANISDEKYRSIFIKDYMKDSFCPFF
jgi:hypothetical protein